MKRTKIVYIRGMWLAFTMVLAVMMLGQSGSAQTPGKQAVPEFFGVYLWTDGSLKEIPDVNPEFKKLVDSTDRRATGEKSNVDFFLRLLGICYAVNQKASFVLYHNLAKPEMFSLKRVVPLTDGKQVEIRLGIAPIEGKNFMYRLVPREELTTGVYYFKATGEFGTSGFFSCLAVNTTADQLLDRLKAETTSGIPNPPSTAPQPAVRVGASCADYSSCLSGGTAAFKSSQWAQSLALFQKASSLEPTKPDAWAGMGRAYLELGNSQEAWEFLDRGLRLGAAIELAACRQRLGSCEQGTLILRGDEVSFLNSRGEKVFGAPPSAVTSREARSFSDAAYSWLTIANKNYRLFPIPKAVECQIDTKVVCPEPGFTQQKVSANYVHHAIQGLTAGTPAKP